MSAKTGRPGGWKFLSAYRKLDKFFEWSYYRGRLAYRRLGEVAANLRDSWRMEKRKRVQLRVDQLELRWLPTVSATLLNYTEVYGSRTELQVQTSSDTVALSFSPEMGTARASMVVPVDVSDPGTQYAHANLTQAAPGTPIALSYNSNTADVYPIVPFGVQTDPDEPVASSIQAGFSWNGGSAVNTTFSTSGHSGGDNIALAVQVGSRVTASGYYPFSIAVTVNYPAIDGGAQTTTLSGDLAVVVGDQSNPLGDGWSLAGVDQIIPVTGGALYVTGSTGTAEYFSLLSYHAGGTSTYTSPPDAHGALVQNPDNSFTYTGPDQTEYNFNSSGYETSIVDPAGPVRTFLYDGSNRLTAILDPDGSTATFSYSSGVLSTIQAPGGRTTTLLNDGSGNITSVLLPDGSATDFAYDGSHRLTNIEQGSISTTFAYSSTSDTLATIALDSSSNIAVAPIIAEGLITSTTENLSQAEATVTMPGSHTTSYVFDSTSGAVTKISYPDNTSESWTVNSAGQPLTYVDGLGHTTSYLYDASGNVTETLYPDTTDSQATYNTFGEPLTETDQLGHTTSFSYDGYGELLTITTPLNEVTTVTWSGGLEQTVEDPLGKTTTYSYNSSRQTTSIEDPLANRTTYLYSAAGFVTGVIDPRGNLAQYGYDGMGRVTATTDPTGDVAHTYYNANGLVTETVDPVGTEATAVYDAQGRVTSTTTAAGTSLAATDYDYYDASGNLTGTKDPNGNLTQFLFDSVGRVTEMVDAFGSVTTKLYDANGQVSSTTTASGTGVAATTYEYYDIMGNVTGVKDALTYLTQYEYDALGRVTESIDANSNTTTMVYDADERLSSTTTGAGSSAAATSNDYYDAAGHVTEVTDPRSTPTTSIYTQYLYDADGRVTSTAAVVGTLVLDTAYHYYDAAGNLTGTKDPNGNLSQTLYDADNRPTVTVDPLGRVTEDMYDADGRATETINAEGFATQNLYDAAGNLTETMNGVFAGVPTVPDIVANGQTGYSESGSGWSSFSDSNAYGGTERYATAGSGSNTATWEIQGLYAGAYNVEVTWTAYSNRATNATYKVYDNATLLGTETINQQLAPASGLVEGGVTFQSLGRFVVTSGTLKVVLSDNANGYVIANAVLAQAAANPAVIDEQQYGYSETGSGWATAADSNAYNGYERYDNAAATTLYDTATWQLTNLEPGAYDVEVTWVQYANRATNATYDVYDGSTLLGAVVENQQVAPYGGQTVSGVAFQSLGRFTIDSGTLKVVLSNNANGYVIANAMLAVGNSTTELVDNSQYGFTTSGSGWSSFSDSNAYYGNELYAAAGSGANTATWTVVGLPGASYDVEVNWVAYANRATNAAYQIYDGATLLATVTVNQQNSPSGGVTMYGVAFQSLGHYTIDSGTLKVVLSDNANGYVIADAMLVEPAGPLGAIDKYTHDKNGNVTTVTDGDGNVTTYVYDAMNRATVTIDALANRTTEMFDAAGNITEIKDASNNVTTFAYNAGGELVSETNANGYAATFAYDAVGNVNSITDFDGRVVTYAYDADNREVGETWHSGNASSSVTNIATYTYDSAGDMLTAANDNGAYTMSYDALGRVTGVQELGWATLTFQYDSDGNRTVVQDSFGGTQTSTYDGDNELVTQQFSMPIGTLVYALEIDLTYTSTGELASEARRNALGAGTPIGVGYYYYDGAGRLTGITDIGTGSSVLATYAYAYDPANNLTQEVDGTSAVATIAYSYDKDNQLTNAATTTSLGTSAVTYSYDSTGNRTNSGYSTGTGNELTAQGGWTYSYDHEGNETGKTNTSGEVWSYSYDNKNELIQAVDVNGSTTTTVSYEYDAFGNRIQEAVSVSTTTVVTTTRFVQDGWNPHLAGGAGNSNWFVWADLSYTSGSGNSLQTRYVGGDVVDQLFARIADNGTSGTMAFLLADHLGSIVGVTNSSGSLQDAITYDPYGHLLTESNPGTVGSYQYAGMIYDALVGLYFSRARYFDPVAGRWISEDPLGFNAGASNLYRYVNNNPTILKDSSGLFPDNDNWEPPGVRQITRGHEWETIKSVSSFLGTVVFGVGETILPVLGPTLGRDVPIRTPGEYWGRQIGRGIGTAIGIAMTVQGAIVTGAGLGGGILFALPTYGGSLVVGVGISAIGVVEIGWGLTSTVQGLTLMLNQGGPPAGDGGGGGGGNGGAVGNPQPPGNPGWRLGSNHTAQQWANRMAQRGWTRQQISEAIENGQQIPAVNNVNPGNAATRYVHPTTGRSVVVDNVTNEVIHVGGDGFVY
jgi:RHS repeat-associated protein